MIFLILKKLKQIIKLCIPHGIIYLYDRPGGIHDYLYSKKYFNTFYKDKNKNNSSRVLKTIIYVADGRIKAGGLADRLRGLVSLYKISKEIKVNFKIYFTSPNDLTNYLVPNKYNWIIHSNELIYNIKESIILNLAFNTDENDAINIFNNLFKKYNQLHITTAMRTIDNEYSILFNELFKPSIELQTLIDYHLSIIDHEFISVSFRFRTLLGDFIDGENIIIKSDKQFNLINRCLDHLDDIHFENLEYKTLVTSDSNRFLNEANKKDYVYIIPGEITHTDYSDGFDKDYFMKTFVDYFLLTYSKKNYLVLDKKIYNSGFPYRASLHRSSFIIKRYE